MEVSGSAEHLPAGSRSVVRDEPREAEERSSPLSLSPTAKMIKMGELAEASSRSPDPSVEPLSASLNISSKYFSPSRNWENILLF